ncbi:MAG: hypothetical protein AVDCRST_MAG40-2691, partial [uncultured Gemmatimonadaceae bacterium]
DHPRPRRPHADPRVGAVHPQRRYGARLLAARRPVDGARGRQRHRRPLLADGAVAAEGLGPRPAQAHLVRRDLLHARRRDHPAGGRRDQDRAQGRLRRGAAQHPPRLPRRQRDRALPQRLHAREPGSAGPGTGHARGRTRAAAQRRDPAAGDEPGPAAALRDGRRAGPGPAAPRRAL